MYTTRRRPNFVFIDYSGIYYTSLQNSSVPLKRSGKFVQIRHSGAEYLLLSPVELSPYHANIAEKFFSGQNISGMFNKKQDYFECFDPGWEITGGGIWSINEKEKSLYLSGSSQAYGKYDGSGLKENIVGVKGFEDYSVGID